MAKFFGFEDLAMERTSLQQLRTELNSSDSKCSFLLDRGSKLSFKDLITSLSTLSTRIKVVAKDNFRQFLPYLKCLLGGWSVMEALPRPEARRLSIMLQNGQKGRFRCCKP